jgi:hypothetical protein
MSEPIQPSTIKPSRLNAIWDRLRGQFWCQAALLATDLPEGPRRPRK